MRTFFFLCHLAGLLAHYRANGQVEDGEFTCTEGGKKIPLKYLCDGDADCPVGNSNSYSGARSEDEDPAVCAASRHFFRAISLKSEAQPNGSVLLSWSWDHPPGKANLKGYFVKGQSAHHSFSATISPVVTSYLLPCLHGWTHYKVIVQPYYSSHLDISQIPRGLGRPAEVSFMTASSEPSAPTRITMHSDHSVLNVVGPLFWNSEPLGFEVEWVEKEVTSRREHKEVALPPGWSREENELNVTLPLLPGREYNVSVRAQGKGAQGNVLTGAVLSIMAATTPAAPVELKARVLDFKSAIISWLPSSPAQYFLVELRSRAHQESNSISSVQVAGSSIALEEHSFPLLDLNPLNNYTASVQACLMTTCSEKAETEFGTPRRRLSAPLIETIKCVSTESVMLEWSYTQEGLPFNPEFEIRLYNSGIYRSMRTDNMKLTVNNLTALTTYRVEIRAVLDMEEGLSEAGPPAEAVITTWPSVPLQPVINVYEIEAMSDVVITSWTFLNSSVEELQVAITEDDWAVCNHDPVCKSEVLLKSNSSYMTGYLEINILDPLENYTVYIRGCNKYGCGNATTAHVSGCAEDPGEVTSLTTKQFNNTSVLLTWAPPLNTPSGYIVFWQCDNDEVLGKCTTQNEVEIAGLPLDEWLCTFSVSAYIVLRHEEEIVGKACNLSLSWP